MAFRPYGIVLSYGVPMVEGVSSLSSDAQMGLLSIRGMHLTWWTEPHISVVLDR